MTLVLKKPLVLRNQLPADADADAYIAAVEAADGQALEPGVKFAIKNFVLCCKQDGIWDAIKASCILAGARTLNGALVPLVGTAPTNFNFVSSDYNRKTGLVGDGSTKYLDSNRNNNADPQNSNHNACYITQLDTSGIRFYMGRGGNEPGANVLGHTGNATFIRIRMQEQVVVLQSSPTELYGVSRSSNSQLSCRVNKSNIIVGTLSDGVLNGNVGVFGRGDASTTARLAFYSIGESLDLALLDARVTDLINAFGAAIP
jgi:hypothetical protein